LRVDAGPGTTCGPGTYQDGGECISAIVCGTGTVDANGQCVVLAAADAGAKYEVRVLSPQLVADGFSVDPFLAIGTNADGTPATDSVVLGTTLTGAGTFDHQSFALGAIGHQGFFTPCSSTSAGCTGDFQVTLALASAPNVPVATSESLTLQAPQGIGDP